MRLLQQAEEAEKEEGAETITGCRLYNGLVAVFYVQILYFFIICKIMANRYCILCLLNH